MNEIYFKKCQETGNVELLTKCKFIIEKDGKYYLSETGKVDDENNAEISEAEAVKELAQQEAAARNKKLQERKKQKAIEQFENFIKNPAKNTAALKDDRLYRETILTVLSDPQAVCKGVDAMGNETEKRIINSIKELDIKTIEDLPDDLPDDIKLSEGDKFVLSLLRKQPPEKRLALEHKLFAILLQEENQ